MRESFSSGYPNAENGELKIRRPAEYFEEIRSDFMVDETKSIRYFSVSIETKTKE